MDFKELYSLEAFINKQKLFKIVLWCCDDEYL